MKTYKGVITEDFANATGDADALKKAKLNYLAIGVLGGAVLSMWISFFLFKKSALKA